MMLQYILRRLLAAIPVLIGILLVTFALARMIPGDPCRALLGEKATQEVCDRFMREKGLDKPIHEQFFYLCQRYCQGRFRHIPAFQPTRDSHFGGTPSHDGRVEFCGPVCQHGGWHSPRHNFCSSS